MKVLCRILWSLAAIPFCAAVFEDLPRIHTDNGNLFIVSGQDKNITLQTTGTGYIYANGINLLRPSMYPASGIFNSTYRIGRLNRMVAAVQRDLDNPRTGIKRRLRTLENRTRTMDNGGAGDPPNRRLRQINNRLRTLTEQVTSLMQKLAEDNCRSHPCQNGGVCVDLFDSFLCQCPDNWEGPTCGADVNECARFHGTDLGCQNGATCANTPGSYNCICASGYQGIHCTGQNMNCATSGSQLCGHGTCIQKGATFDCICDQGWTKNGISPECTTDVNECLSDTPHCSKDPLVHCENLPGSFRCGACPAGFTGNGFYCSDIDECSVNNGGCSIAPYVQCINTRGASACGNCPVGYIGDGRSCEGRPTGVLGLCSNNICHPLATCSEIGGVVNCRCPPTHSGHGMAPDGCTPNANPPCPLYPCKNGGTCNMATLSCNCRPGYQLPYCDASTLCTPNPCQNGGECVENTRENTFSCSCPANFQGTLCDRQLSTCNAVLRGNTGTLSYPPANTTQYSNNARCAWLIRTQPDQVLNVTFTKFFLEDSNGCKFDFLQIHDGSTSAAQILGRFCGSTFPLGGNFLSTRDTLYLFFRSDASHTNDGFSLSWNSTQAVCGDTIADTEKFGTIVSPGSPGNYPPNRDCWWYFTAPPGKRIQFHFLTMKLESHVDCAFDYLAIHDGLREESPVLEKFCNTSHPEPFVSPGNEIAMHFHSDADNTDTGFQIHYTVVEGVPGCGGTYTSMSGEISSPTKDGQYQHNLECEYLIKMAPGSRVSIEFTEFDIEDHSDCGFDYLELYEGGSDRDPLVRRYCGAQLPSSYKSLGNKVLLKFKSDYSNAGKGFRITFAIVCGGTFNSENGIISSPMYPNRYFDSRQCVYEIVAPLGKSITLNFIDFDVEGNSYPECSYDSLEVYDGIAQVEGLLGKYCSDVMPPRLQSKINLMTLVFTTDTSLQGRGWQANYTFTDMGCGGVIKEANQTITPPLNTENGGTKHGENCTWIIIAPEKGSVNLYWNSFDIEETDGCTFDYVEVFDGWSTNHSSKYCGTSIPPVMTSMGNVMRVTFVSDSTVSSQGFSLTYSFSKPGEACGGTYLASSGYIQSPNYPDKYPPFRDCTWIIQAPTGHQIQLKSNAFVMESHDNCNFDFLEVRNGASNQSALLGKYCGTTFPNNLRSLSNVLFVHFVSDFSHSESGFEIEWQSTATGCGGILSSHEGSVSSPNYPLPYDHRALCTYRISTSQGSNLQLIFDDLDFEDRSYCFDTVEVLDGKTMKSLTGGPICSKPTPFNVTTSDNSAIVIFKSDSSDAGRGFSMRYKTLCSRKLSGFGGVIESPNFPDNYPHRMDCDWSIDVPLGNEIGIEFSHFAMEDPLFGRNCEFDSLEIAQLDGQKTVIESKKYCKEKPKPFESSARSVQIKMHTDVSQSESGFRLEWRIQGCGGVLDRPTGRIAENNFNRSTPTECVWKIVTGIGKHIELNIEEFHYQSSGECSNVDEGGLMIANNEQFTHPILVQCSLLTPGTVVRSSGHEMYIRLVMKARSPTTFIAIHSEAQRDCGGTLTNKGTITSTQYPDNYKANQDCEWLLTVPPGQTMTITIVDIDLVESPDCNQTSLRIFDDNQENPEKSLFKWCNSTTPAVNKFTTTTNQALVKFNSGPTAVAKGFMINFVANCGYNIFTNGSGTIQLHDNGPPKNCTWVIRSGDPLARISFVVNHFSGNTTDFRDVLSVDPVSFTQADTHTMFVMGNQLTVKLRVVGPTKLEASYSVYEDFCGGTFSSIQGKIASPNYPFSYPRNVECIYLITAEPGNAIELAFDFELEESDHCADDYIEVRERDGAGQVVDAFCGNGRRELKVNGTAWIKFKSDEDETRKGFIVSHRYARDVEVNKDFGELASPVYPVLLTSSNDYSWRISVQFGHVMLISFQEFLLQRLENGLCAARFTVYDGFNEQAPVLISDQCGYSPPSPVMSTSNYVFVTASFNEQVGSRFKLKWEAQLAKDPSSVEKCNSSTIIVGNTTQVLTSPGFPNGYDTYLNCSWVIKSDDPAFHATFTPLVVDMEETVGCTADYLSIHTSSDLVNWQKNASICTDENRRIYHGTPYLMVQFNSDSYLNKTGFRGFVARNCGGRFTDRSGVISIKAGSMRGLTTTCDWQIEVRNGRRIQFTFDEFVLPPNDGTCQTFISLKNGPNEFSPMLGEGTYCGPAMPTNISETFSNMAFVRFSQRLMMNSVSFTLRYEEVALECGDEIILSDNQNSTIIHSPRYPNTPDAHSECTWNIWSKSGESLKVEFIDRFDLTISNNCEAEYVEVRSGTTKYSPVLGRFCGKTPDPLQSPTNALQVKYYSDIPYPKNGFKARISFAGCHRIFRGNSGSIFTVPELHVSPSAVCEYMIVASPFYKLSLVVDDDFPDLDDHDEENMSFTQFEVVAVYPTGILGNETTVSLGKYHHGSIPSEIFVESNKAIIRFNASLTTHSHYQLKLRYTAKFNNCGGPLTAASGELTSPGYPSARYRQKFCNWLITAPKGRRVKVEFLELDLNQTHSFMQKLNFFNDPRSALRITSISGNTIPDPIYSTDNIMKITYFVINAMDIRGFRLRFSSDEPSICEGNLNDQSGILESPANISSLYCAYERTDKPFFTDTTRGTISFRMQDTRLSNPYFASVRCSPFQSRLRFTRSFLETDQDLGLFCGNITDKTLASPFTNTKLDATILNQNARYKIYYEVEKCGEIFTGPFEIRSADLPSKAGSLNCAWFYKSDTLADLSLIYNASFVGSCAEEYITVHNGPSADSPQLEKICGPDPAANIHSRSSTLFIQYHANVYSNRSRFNFKVDTLLGTCGGTVHKSIEMIASPGNGTYANNMECTWDFTADLGYVVNMTFIKRFYLEDSTNCSKDSVEVFDFVNEGWVSLGKFCGRQQPGRLVSSESQMRVTFKTDSRVVGDGFTISWEQSCGGLYQATDTPKILTSPGYPSRYMPNLRCNYTLVAPKDKYIRVKFTDFQLEVKKNCDFDNVTIHRKLDYAMTDSLDLSETFCSSNTPPTQRGKDKMWIVFRTDKFVQKKGFQFTYQLDKCGGIITEPTTIHSNPNSDKYSSDQSCTWNITAPTDKEIVIRFDYIELQYAQGCYSDYVDVFSGVGDGATRLIHMCGNHTTVPAMKLQHSDGSILFKSAMGYMEAYRGFSASVFFVRRCDRRINLTTSAPNYELSEKAPSYGNDMDCHYTILAPQDYTLKLEFTDFHMQECPKSNETVWERCACDYLEVRDGRGPFSELIGKYCGHDLPPSIPSTRDGLYLRLVTDSAHLSTGFSSRLSIVPNSCGQLTWNITEENPKVRLTFPLSGNSYPNNVNCLWTITVPENEYVNMALHFNRMDIQNGTTSDKCDHDFLEVYDNMHRDVIHEGLGADTVFNGAEQTHSMVSFWESRNVMAKHVYCGNTVPPVFTSKTNLVYVRFKSDADVTGRGFEIIASKTTGCHPTYDQLQGRIMSSSSKECLINIDVPTNYTIALYFTSFLYNCEEGKEMEIFDGSTSSGTVKKYCGYTTPDPFFSTGNSVVIRMNKLEYGSYDITYLATDQGRGCGGTLFNYYGTFSSPMFPNTNRNPSDCRWNILVPTNLKVSLRFQLFDMGSKNYCNSDYVVLYDVTPESETEISRFCGGDAPGVIVGKSNAMAVRFVKTVNFSGSGFKLEFMGVFENANVTNY